MNVPREEKGSEARLLQNLIKHLAILPVEKIPRKTGGPRRSAVAIIIRVRPNSVVGPLGRAPATRDPLEFLKLGWVKTGEPEVLFVRRAANVTDRWSGHMAFPGGKAEPNETDQQAAERESIEEIGLDLTSPEYLCLGALDDRKVTPAASTKAVLILSPFVYLQLVPATPPLILLPEEIASIHWIPMSFFLAAARKPTRWRAITFPIARHLLSARVYSRSQLPTAAAPVSWGRSFHIGLEKSVTWILGRYSYFGVLLPTTAGEIVTPLATPTATIPSPARPYLPTHHNHNHQEPVATHELHVSVANTGQSTADRLLLWGLTLWMTSDLMDLCSDPADLPAVPLVDLGAPKYSHPDVDWCFGVLARHGFSGLFASRAGGGPEGQLRALPQRKPAVSVSVRSRMEIYHAIRISVITAMTFRVAVAWLLLRNVRKVFAWFKAVL